MEGNRLLKLADDSEIEVTPNNVIVASRNKKLIGGIIKGHIVVLIEGTEVPLNIKVMT